MREENPVLILITLLILGKKKYKLKLGRRKDNMHLYFTYSQKSFH